MNTTPIDFDLWRTQLSALVDCTRKLKQEFAHLPEDDALERTGRLLAERRHIIEQLDELGKTLREYSPIAIPADVRVMFDEARTLAVEALEMLATHRKAVLEEIKKADRHQGYPPSPYGDV